MGAVKRIKMAPAVVEHPGTRTTDSLEATVIDQSVAPATRPHTRESRALRLYEERGAEIVRTGPWTYLVPSMSGGEPHAVNYKTEVCDCPDFEYRGVLCAHVYAVGIHRAKKRGASSGICPR